MKVNNILLKGGLEEEFFKEFDIQMIGGCRSRLCDIWRNMRSESDLSVTKKAGKFGEGNWRMSEKPSDTTPENLKRSERHLVQGLEEVTSIKGKGARKSQSITSSTSTNNEETL